MSLSILDSTTQGAVTAATTQVAQLQALESAWGGGNVNAWVYDSGDILLQRRVQGPWTINGTPALIPGALISWEHFATGTPAYVVYRTASAAIFSTDGITFAGPIRERCGTWDRKVVFSANAALPVTEVVFDAVNLIASQANPPGAASGKIVILNLHASGGDPTGSGLLYEADCSGELAYSTSTTWRFALQGKTDSQTAGAAGMQIRPLDRAGTYPDSAVRQSYHMGWITDFGTGSVALRLASERRMETLMRWVDANVSGLSATKRCATGDSMGAWGSLRFAIRRPELFAAVYPDRPIWRWNATGKFQAPRWDINSAALYDPGATPPLAAEDGPGTLQSQMDLIAYVASGAPIPWIGWCVGRQDGFMAFSDHVAAVNALRARRAGFAFVWNDGNHSTGSILSQIVTSYPFGLFELGKGYPRFENCSLDADPAVDLAGGINVGLTFRNVVESATSWACEVTHINSACTVDVSPISTVYPNGATDTPISVTIPAANTWVPVSFEV